ncbi:MAG: sporulation protein YunB [Clostridia bacterium]
MHAKNRQKKGFRILILLILLILAGVIALEQQLSQTMLDMAYARAYSLAVETMNRAVKDTIVNGARYDELVTIQTDLQGRVSVMRANTMRMNEIATKTALMAEEELAGIENQIINIPLGSAFGIRFLAGFGPTLAVRILPIGAVRTNFETEFESAGINQTRHKISLSMRTTVSLIVPRGAKKVEVVSNVPIAESIIVGQVPTSYVDVSDQEDMLNLIP